MVLVPSKDYRHWLDNDAIVLLNKALQLIWMYLNDVVFLKDPGSCVLQYITRKKSYILILTNLIVFLSVFLGEKCWMAPESVRLLQWSDKSDIWSLGCILLDMLICHRLNVRYSLPLFFFLLPNILSNDDRQRFPSRFAESAVFFQK